MTGFVSFSECMYDEPSNHLHINEEATVYYHEGVVL